MPSDRGGNLPSRDAGGERGAAIYSLIGTVKLNGIDPEAYLANVPARIADHPVRHVDALPHWNLASPAGRPFTGRDRGHRPPRGIL